MLDSQRLEEVLNYLNLSALEMSRRVGLKSAQRFYDVKSGKCKISRVLAESIQENFPEISAAWLLTGEGEMLRVDSDPAASADIPAPAQPSRSGAEVSVMEKMYRDVCQEKAELQIKLAKALAKLAELGAPCKED